MDDAADDVTVDVLLRVWRERAALEPALEVEPEEREGAPEWLGPRNDRAALERGAEEDTAAPAR